MTHSFLTGQQLGTPPFFHGWDFGHGHQHFARRPPLKSDFPVCDHPRNNKGSDIFEDYYESEIQPDGVGKTEHVKKTMRFSVQIIQSPGKMESHFRGRGFQCHDLHGAQRLENFGIFRIQ